MNLTATIVYCHGVIISFSILGLLCGMIFLLLILIDRTFHTVTYMLLGNVIISCCFYLLIVLSNHTNALFFQTLSIESCRFVSYLMISCASSISYSLMLQSISRLFFIVYYRHRKILTFEVHIFLLICIWLISLSVSPLPAYLLNGLRYNPSLYLCDVNINSIFVILYVTISGCFIPFSIIGMIYFSIMISIRKQRNTRVVPTSNNHLMDRNLLVLRTIMINVGIMSLTGLPSFIIMILILLKQTGEIVNIYCTLFTVCGVVSMIITSFLLTKNLRKTFLKLIFCQKIN